MENIFKTDGEDEYQKGMALLASSEDWNVRKAFSCFCIAAEAGHAEAIFAVGYLYMYGAPHLSQNASRAVECFRKSADSGLIIAKYHLALCYLTGNGTEKDVQTAIHLLEDAFHSGDAFAADKLCDLYRDGMGVPVDIDKALEYIKFAKEVNYPNADIKYLGLMLRKGSL